MAILTSRGPVLDTARLRLSLLEPADAPRVRAYFERNREHFRPWDPPRPEHFYTDGYWHDKLEQARPDLEADRAIRFFVVRREAPSGPVIGVVNFTRLVRGPFQCAGVGYSLDHDAVGQGLMQEALRAAITWLFESHGFHRVEANYRPENARSGRVLAALGFVIEGYARDYLVVDGAWRDHVLTSLTRHDSGPEK
jgi:[ribosomal protein S5]-alanine N-acetyltransferase